MPSQKSSKNSSSVEIDIISSKSSKFESSIRISSQKRRSIKKKNPKKPHSCPPDPLGEDEVHEFWGATSKAKFVTFKKGPMVLSHVVNLGELEDYHCKVTAFLRAQKLSLLLRLCGVEYYEKATWIFYANLRRARKSNDLETFILGVHIVINSRLFKDVFGCEFSADVPYMNRNWSDNFKVSLKEARAFFYEEPLESSNFGTLSFYFEHRILAHIVATTLVPRKGSLSNISNRDVFMMYCLLKKYQIN